MAVKIIIIGSGGHSKVVKEIVDLYTQFQVIGYTDLEEKGISNISYLGNDNVIFEYAVEDVFLVNGIGSVAKPVLRRQIYEKFKKRGYKFYSVIHPKTIISPSAQLDEGVHVIGGVVINAYTKVKENVIVNTSSSIDHDCIIEKHTHIAPGVTISGGVKIGQSCHIGTGAKIIQNITIGDNVFIGAGAVVVKNVPAGVKTLGVSCRT